MLALGDGRATVRLAPSSVSLLAAIAVAALMTWGTGAVTGEGVTEAPPWAEKLEVREPRVVILKSKRKLHLFDGAELVRSYEIALGSRATGRKTRRGDGRTPEGLFRVCTKNKDSPYHRFMGISYPAPAAAERGLRHGLISYGEALGILEAHAANRCPSWTTALGGGIGIHGRGTQSDWTAGCIALANEDAGELFSVLRLGDPVEILP